MRLRKYRITEDNQKKTSLRKITMKSEPIQKQLAFIASQAYENSKEKLVWCGHALKKGYAKYAVPTAEKLSALALKSFNQFQKMAQNSPSMILGIASGLLLIGVTAFKIADRKAYEENVFAKTAWKTAGIAAFISATAVTSVGLYTVLSI
jgi:hypothetical protein